MIKSVWNMFEVVHMQAEVIEEYNGTLIYTLKAEENSLCIEVNNALLRVGYSPYALSLLKKMIDAGTDQSVSFCRASANFEEFVKCHVLDRLDSYANNERGSTLNFQFANAAGLLEKALEARSKREAIRLRIKEDEAAKEVVEALERVKREEEALIKTRGWINTNLVSIHLDGCRCKTKIAKGNRLAVSKSKSVWDSLRMLKTALEIE